MFVLALLMLGLGAAMIVGGVLVPVAAIGLIAGGLGVAGSGLFLAYLNAPSRRPAPQPGMLPAKARILDATALPGSVAGYQMVELRLEVRPRDGVPFEARRKFSAGRLGRVEVGRELDVLYDAANPERVELA